MRNMEGARWLCERREKGQTLHDKVQHPFDVREEERTFELPPIKQKRRTAELKFKTPAKTRARHARRHRLPTLRRRRVGGCELRMAEMARAFRVWTVLFATASVACALYGAYNGKASGA